MPLKPGDEIILSVAPSFAIRDFIFSKAMASIKRTLSEDVEGDLADMKKTLTTLVYHSIETELKMRITIERAFEERGEEGLLDYLEENGHALEWTQSRTSEAEEGREGGRATGQSVRTGGGDVNPKASGGSQGGPRRRQPVR